MGKVDFLISGAGLYGAVVAQQLTERGKRCLVIDKNNHIAGNCYTELTHGIHVHRHGPHIFATNSKELWDYANRFSLFNQYFHKVCVSYNDHIFSFPINLMTLCQIYGVTTPSEARKKLDEVKLSIDDPQNLEEWCLSQVGPELYSIFIYGYTKKQWGKEPRELPASIIKRIPIRYTYDDRYHQKVWSGIPENGYTQWIGNMLDGVKVELGVDFFSLDWRRYAHQAIYTGKIDALFNYCFGELEYRSLQFKDELLEGDFQGISQVNYTDESIPWTRITEHKHFQNRHHEKTIITREYPLQYTRDAIPYYPVTTDCNVKLYEKYKRLTNNKILVGGRLGRFQYMDMDATIASALKQVNELLHGLSNTVFSSVNS